MATLRIIRTSEQTNRIKNIIIFLDNQELGAISSDENKDFEINAGTHTSGKNRPIYE